MAQPDTISTLNRLMAILTRSLPQYVLYARPYVPAGSEEVFETFAQIARDQTAMSERVSEVILQNEGSIDTGEFAIEFASMHDLGIGYILAQAIEYQRLDIASVEEIVDALRFAPAARSLAEESLGMAKGHLELLEEATAASSTVVN